MDGDWITESQSISLLFVSIAISAHFPSHLFRSQFAITFLLNVSNIYSNIVQSSVSFWIVYISNGPICLQKLWRKKANKSQSHRYFYIFIYWAIKRWQTHIVHRRQLIFLFVLSGHLMVLLKIWQIFLVSFGSFFRSPFCAFLYLCACMRYNRISNALVRAERSKSGKKHSNETVDSLVDILLKIEIGKMPYKYFACINRDVVKRLLCNEIMLTPSTRHTNWPIAKFVKIKHDWKLTRRFSTKKSKPAPYHRAWNKNASLFCVRAYNCTVLFSWAHAHGYASIIAFMLAFGHEI